MPAPVSKERRPRCPTQPSRSRRGLCFETPRSAERCEAPQHEASERLFGLILTVTEPFASKIVFNEAKAA